MDLKLEAKQNQTLSQRMIQSAEILQMTAEELNTYINELTLENPVIDMVSPATPGCPESIEQRQWLNSFNEENYYLYQRQNNDDEYDFKDSWDIRTDEGETLADYLWSQLITGDFTDEEQEILKFMLECLDDKGYLEEDLGQIAKTFQASPEKIEFLLETIQGLDPAGVGARSLEECLKLQLVRRQMATPALLAIVSQGLELVAKNQVNTIARKFRLSAGEAAGCCQIIKSLNPKPGISFSSREKLRYIIPDVTIVKFKDSFSILLNESMYPSIAINDYYRRLGQESQAPEVLDYLNGKIRQAEWVRQCIAQRAKTLMDVSKAILARQEAFFATGPSHLSPLTMAQLAEELGVHESTVSRAVSKKYLQCSWGVYPMSYFFSRKVGAAGSAGPGLTAAGIQDAMEEIIKSEDKRKPYSDRLLAEKLAERGISISRRTVAKYREERGIGDASSRKEYDL